MASILANSSAVGLSKLFTGSNNEFQISLKVSKFLNDSEIYWPLINTNFHDFFNLYTYHIHQMSTTNPEFWIYQFFHNFFVYFFLDVEVFYWDQNTKSNVL